MRAGMRLGGLAAFEAGTVDLNNDLSGLTEKGIDTLRAELAALDSECADELRKAVHANYTHFISASQARPPCRHLRASHQALARRSMSCPYAQAIGMHAAYTPPCYLSHAWDGHTFQPLAF